MLNPIAYYMAHDTHGQPHISTLYAAGFIAFGVFWLRSALPRNLRTRLNLPWPGWPIYGGIVVIACVLYIASWRQNIPVGGDELFHLEIPAVVLIYVVYTDRPFWVHAEPEKLHTRLSWWAALCFGFTKATAFPAIGIMLMVRSVWRFANIRHHRSSMATRVLGECRLWFTCLAPAALYLLLRSRQQQRPHGSNLKHLIDVDILCEYVTAAISQTGPILCYSYLEQSSCGWLADARRCVHVCLDLRARLYFLLRTDRMVGPVAIQSVPFAVHFGHFQGRRDRNRQPIPTRDALSFYLHRAPTFH